MRRIVPTLTDIGTTLAPLYIATAMFALRAQQSITNWDDRSAYVFDNASRYLSLVQLHTTTARPIQFHDQLLFLQADEHPFTPNDPWGTLFFSVTISTALFRFQTTFFIVISSNSFTHKLIPTCSHPTSFSKCVALIMAHIYCEPATVILPPSPVNNHQLPCPIYLINFPHRHPHQSQRPTLHILLRRSVEVLSLMSFGHCRIDKHLYCLPPTIARHRMIFIDHETTTPILMIPDRRPSSGSKTVKSK
jgi:hypothetical protein